MHRDASLIFHTFAMLTLGELVKVHWLACQSGKLALHHIRVMPTLDKLVKPVKLTCN